MHLKVIQMTYYMNIVVFWHDTNFNALNSRPHGNSLNPMSNFRPNSASQVEDIMDRSKVQPVRRAYREQVIILCNPLNESTSKMSQK